ncbi:NAD(P)-dependent oxidoreductase [Methylobacterium sp. J-077]|nr:NAD(P)-dependent oxidoreductase [Methylobacterium sp. J-077]MCJ2122372.1 NAD(P)-dependent oxidoreductase [Methylobacterium sp. J-077]
MAMNLLRVPGGLVVGARKPEQLAEFERWGARTTTRLSDVAEAHVIFLCLPDGDAVEAVLFGPDGQAERLRPDTVIVDTSTIAYAQALELAGRLANLRVHFLDAPVSGMAARAADGTLTVMCGGDPNVFESVRKHLDLIGNKIVYAGPSGSGQLIKLINQLLFDINAAALAEILPMSAKLGLNSDLVAEVVNSVRAGATRPNSSFRAYFRGTSSTATRWHTPTRTW